MDTSCQKCGAKWNRDTDNCETCGAEVSDALGPDAASVDPYALPESHAGGPRVSDGAGAWRRKKTLIIDRESRLPDRCVKCNAPAEERLHVKISWHKQWVYLSRRAINHSIEWAKVYLQRSTLLYQGVMRWKARRVGSLLVRKNTTKIVIEAYPRSANSFSVRLFRQANPGYAVEEVSHHTHIISNVKHAAKWKIPVLIILRDPVDAISSMIVVRGDTSDGMLRIEATRYVDFYDWIEHNLDEVVLTDFSSIIDGRFKTVLQRLNRRFGTNFNADFDEATLANEVRENIVASSPNRDNPAHVPIPSANRDAQYADLRPRIRSHPALADAIALHARLRDTLDEASIEPEGTPA